MSFEAILQRLHQDLASTFARLDTFFDLICATSYLCLMNGQSMKFLNISP